MFEKNLNIGYLLDFYGDVLTERKKDALDLYYNNDMSLSEIADEMGISRQGVRDIIKKAEDENVLRLRPSYQTALKRDSASDDLDLFQLTSEINERLIRRVFGQKNQLFLIGIIVNAL